MGNAHAYNHKNYNAKQNIVRQTKVLASRKHEKWNEANASSCHRAKSYASESCIHLCDNKSVITIKWNNEMTAKALY